MRERQNEFGDGISGEQLRLTRLVEVIVVLGAWLIVSSLVLAGSTLDTLDGVLVGVLLVSIGVYDLYTYRAGRSIRLGTVRFVVLLALWLLAFSIQFGDGYALMWDDFLIAIVTLVWGLGSYRLLFHRRSG